MPMNSEILHPQNKFINNPLTSSSEIKVIFNYLIPTVSSNLYIEKYKKGVEILQLNLNQQDQTILHFLLKNKHLIRFVDCGLNLFLKESALKKRFLLATSIVESSPESFDLFLNSEKTKFPKLQFIWLGIRTAFTIMISFFLFKFKGWK